MGSKAGKEMFCINSKRNIKRIKRRNIWIQDYLTKTEHP